MSTRPAVRKLGRLSEIGQVAAKHGFGYVVDGRRLGDASSRRHRELEVAEEGSTRGQRLRAMLDELGPTFVKFGQLLSTRPDVVPPDIVFELKALQDDVTPFPYEQAEEVIEQELGLTVQQLFVEFDRVPVAAASIGQVHRAVLPNGKRVVVKVQRPDAPRQIEADLELLYQAARFVRERRIKALAFVDTVSLVDEFARTIRQELDYRMEARNAEQFHRNFVGHPHVRIPRVFWTYSRSRVLTLEYLEGVHLRDLDFTTYTIEERARLAEVIADAWMAMIFRHGFFHADPHPSNILVLEQSEQIGLVDFGMAGKLTGEDMSKATRLFIDVVNENIERLPRDLAALGVRYDREKEEEFVTEIRDLYYRYYGSRLNELDPIQVIREVFAVIFRMRLELPTRFVMLDRAIATLGSVGLELYPDFNVFEIARPYARELMLERFTPRRIVSRSRQQGSDYLRMALEAPYQVADTLEQVRDGQIEVGFRHEGLDELFHRLDLVFNRLSLAIVAVGGIIGSSMIGLFADAGPQIWGLHFLSVIGFSLSALLGIWLVWGIIRSGRL
jgi:ubiquinone biosynthesis protein